MTENCGDYVKDFGRYFPASNVTHVHCVIHTVILQIYNILPSSTFASSSTGTEMYEIHCPISMNSLGINDHHHIWKIET